ncbi:MAG TPA: Fic family protein [Solirubrobacterales bacterium]|jgi:Fic family protein|nr:Fic family protein [Solirubrobacterales bacterium]
MACRGRYEELTWSPDFRQSGRSRGQARRYKAFIPAEIGDDEPRLESATSALGERAGTMVRELNSDLSGLVSLESLGRQLLRSEALASSQIEGLSIPHRKLAEVELDGRPGPHRALEIMGNVGALERGLEIGAQPGDLSLDSITAIHRELAVAPPLDRIAGQIREETSWIGGTSPASAEYVGPPHQCVRPLLDDLCEFMNRDDISPVPQAAIAHAQFELIHPFGDGNGRVGRCLVHVLFRRRGVAPRYVPPISLVLGADKDAYIAGLQSFRTGDVDGWVQQFARAVEVAAERAREFSAEVAALQAKWRELVQPVRSDAAVLPLIALLPRYPVITAAVAEKELGRSRPATIGALARLHEIGALKRHRNQKKGDNWEATELFRLLKNFEESVRAG